MNNRRRLLVALAAALFTPRAVFAQTKKPPVMIGWLSWQSRATSHRDNFTKEFAALGWNEDSNYVIEERYADGNSDRLQLLAEELTAKKPALIVANPVPAARAAAKAAPKTPIVVIGGDPVAAGIVASYARPGGMVTGISNIRGEFTGKFLELLLAAAPKVRRVGFLLNSASGSYARHKENVRGSVAQYQVEARTVELARIDEVDSALAYLAKEGIQALVVMSEGGLFATERQRIIQFALARGWPVIGGILWADDGALLSYSADNSALARRAAHYVDRILKGTKPADLPIEQPMRFHLVVNLKIAKVLGLTIPPAIMVQATRVIQ